MSAARLISLSTTAALALAASARGDGAFFENRVRPIFVKHCYSCHSAEAKRVKGDLRLDSREHFLRGGSGGPIVMPGEPEKSPLIAAVRYADPDLRMPPDTDGPKKLPDADIATLVEWVKNGAHYPASAPVAVEKTGPLWSLQPLANSPVPVGTLSAVDALLFANAKLPEPTDARTLIRRATYDLTGLPPTAEEVEAFVAAYQPDGANRAYAQLIERLLASPHYGERWGRHWLDVVRYADTAGETADFPAPLAWRYRNDVIESFNRDTPYDVFLREQIAGDLLAPARTTATGFLAVSRRFGFDSENYHHLTIQDALDTLGQAVLGLTVGCARCHDHKFDPITMRDYYALYGILDSTRFAFPGSEQKQRARSVVPLAPANESLRQWREYDARVAALAAQLEKAKQPVPSAILRSLHDADGDFEMQAPAAGGSNGALVPPWIYEGKIDVAASAQSPFRNVFPRGKVGAYVTGKGPYRIAQGLHPQRSAGALHVNLDFRIAAAPGAHRLALGTPGTPALELFISQNSIALGGEALASVKAGVWHSLQLTLDLTARMVSGSVSSPEKTTAFAAKPLSAGAVDFFTLTAAADAAPLDLDNFAAQDFPLHPATTEKPVAALATSAAPEPPLPPELLRLVEIDGGFDFQTADTPPAAPWGPGPNSVVKISATSQSPFRNLLLPGGLGVHMPNRAEYDGFGQSLANARADNDGRLFVAFDFRCASAEKGGDGSWRYYLGNGPGVSAAVELFFNATQFFPRSGDARDAAAAVKVGEWHQVRLALDTMARSYTGTLTGAGVTTEFSGKFATGWNGKIDYTFIDSYGHRGGVRPSLDADHFVIRDTPLVENVTLNAADFRTAAEAHRRRLTAEREQIESAKKELDALLTDGPGEAAYAVAEGTPNDARIQLRGEPDRPGDVVARGFITALGGGPLPVGTPGSGRLALAEWLVGQPLTARVMVNRIWQFHFGSGLVATPNDFGTRGQPPSHPALLDYLAGEFIRRGWSVKEMHRLVMMSAAYQSALLEVPGAQKRRLSAEEIRDSILATSGELDREPGRGHAFPSPLGWSFTQHGPFVARTATFDHDKRSVYLMVQRIKRHPFLALFDGADPNTTTAERRTTTVPTQALFFLNDPFVHSKADKLAARILTEHATDAARITAAHRAVLARNPDDAEIADAENFLTAARAESGEKPALAAFLRTLWGGNEFLHVD